MGDPCCSPFDCLGLSQRDIYDIRSQLKDAGIGLQGRSRSESDLHLFVNSVGVLQRDFSSSEAITKTAQIFIASPAIVRSAVRQYQGSGTITATPTAHRGAAGENSTLFRIARTPTKEEEEEIDRLLNHEVREKGHFHSATTVRAALKQKFGESWKISKRMLYRWMHMLGYTFGDKKYVGSLPPTLRLALARRFIYQYAEAQRQQLAGTHIIVYMDESFIHTKHNTRMCWGLKGSPTGHDCKGGKRAGERLLLIHAMTSTGLMADKECIDANNNLTEEFPTCEVVFKEVGTFNGDYHDCFDGDKFVAWLKYRLLPTVQKLHPGKRMVLVMDNAKYHRPAGHNTVSVSKLTADGCVAFFHSLLTHRSSIDVPRASGAIQSMPLTDYIRRAPHGPTPKEKRAAVKLHLQRNPHISRTQTDDLLDPEQHRVVWTPPYTPEFQPIELLWARVKNAVAQQSLLTRRMDETRHHTESAFARITANECTDMVRHAHDEITAWMRKDSSGSLSQYADFEDLVRHPSINRPIEVEADSQQSAAADSGSDSNSSSSSDADD